MQGSSSSGSRDKQVPVKKEPTESGLASIKPKATPLKFKPVANVVKVKDETNRELQGRKGLDRIGRTEENDRTARGKIPWWRQAPLRWDRRRVFKGEAAVEEEGADLAVAVGVVRAEGESQDLAVLSEPDEPEFEEDDPMAPITVGKQKFNPYAGDKDDGPTLELPIDPAQQRMEQRRLFEDILESTVRPF
ncbi:hypothetical protein HDU96_010523 [Phlyctochytrium bullatum]|nr:hypothetical protein HDU96_010523 [Phlyctochytrium bullatum]